MKHENYISKCRLELNDMTQQELAEKVGVTKQSIQSIELGKSLPSVSLALEIAKVFGKSVEEIFVLNDD